MDLFRLVEIMCVKPGRFDMLRVQNKVVFYHTRYHIDCNGNSWAKNQHAKTVYIFWVRNTYTKMIELNFMKPVV